MSQKDRDWRWCLWASAIINGVTFVTILFFHAETLFDRPDDSTQEIFADDKEQIEQIEDVSSPREPYHCPPMEIKTYLRRLWFWDLDDRPASRQIHAKRLHHQTAQLAQIPICHLFQRSTCTYLHCAHCISINHLTRCPVEKFCDLRACPNRTGIDISPPYLPMIYKFDTAQNG